MKQTSRVALWALCLVVCTAIASMVWAQGKAVGRVSGKVVDEQGTPVPDVTITITCSAYPSLKNVEKTNKRGHFVATHVDAGGQEVRRQSGRELHVLVVGERLVEADRGGGARVADHVGRRGVAGLRRRAAVADNRSPGAGEEQSTSPQDPRSSPGRAPRHPRRAQAGGPTSGSSTLLYAPRR